MPNDDFSSSTSTSYAPLPILSGEAHGYRSTEWRDAPQGVRDAYLLNFLASLLYTCIGVFSTISAFGNRDGFGGVLVALLFLSLGIINGVQCYFHRKANPSGWRIQIPLSIIALLGFPLLTLMNGLLLAKWFRPETKAWYGLDL